MRTHHLLVLLALVAFFCLATAQPVPTPAGLFVELRSDLIQDILNKVFEEVQTKVINQVTTLQITGSQDGAKYELYEFSFTSFNLFPVDLIPQADGSIDLHITFAQENAFDLQFTLYIDLEGAKSHFKLSINNDGDLGFNTNIKFDLQSSDHPTFTATAGWSSADPSQEFNVNAHCDTHPACIVPTEVVRDAARSAVQDALDKLPQKVVDSLNKNLLPKLEAKNLIEQIPDMGIQLNLQGALSFDQATATSADVVLGLNGMFTPIGTASSPFTSAVVPSVLSQPPASVGFVLTDYLFETLIWSLQAAGKLNFEIGEGDLSPNSTFELNTNNKEFLLIAPGLKRYPDMNITIDVAVSDASSLDVDIEDGTIMLNNLELAVSFLLSNYTCENLLAFKLDVASNIEATAVVTADSISLQLQAGSGKSSFKLSVEETTVGNINVILLQTIFNELLQSLSSKPITVPIKPPAGLTSVEVGLGSGYLSIYGDASTELASESQAIVERTLRDTLDSLAQDAQFNGLDWSSIANVISDLKN
eukprot:TRINITY_DN381_c0_g1_i1.p1 TRINITY_DN381_c0_g1~~TRINITY_DN381_c0_g1_i1.p1  ORF type:complete len:533 (-),score=216.24 TRINITY_DN381_c0_g1_i1:359-1957(-)